LAVSDSMVFNILIETGDHTRQRRSAKLVAAVPQVIRLHRDERLTVAQIAARLHLTKEQVIEILTESGDHHRLTPQARTHAPPPAPAEPRSAAAQDTPACAPRRRPAPNREDRR